MNEAEKHATGRKFYEIFGQFSQKNAIF